MVCRRRVPLFYQIFRLAINTRKIQIYNYVYASMPIYLVMCIKLMRSIPIYISVLNSNLLAQTIFWIRRFPFRSLCFFGFPAKNPFTGEQKKAEPT